MKYYKLVHVEMSSLFKTRYMYVYIKCFVFCKKHNECHFVHTIDRQIQSMQSDNQILFVSLKCTCI